jgi:hypothetical protein
MVTLILVGVGVMRIKYEVVFLRKVLRDLETELEKSIDNLNVLSAEWSYLNDPGRLEKLSEKYLKNMRPTENSQIVSLEEIDRCTIPSQQEGKRAPVQKRGGSGLPQESKSPPAKHDLQKKSFDEFINNSLANSMREQYN